MTLDRDFFITTRVTTRAVHRRSLTKLNRPSQPKSSNTFTLTFATMASKDVSLPAFAATSFEDIQAKHDRLRATYRSGKTKDVQFRLQQLRKFYWAITDLEPLILAAVYKDLRKCHHEAVLTEVDWCKGEAMDLINGLEKWLKDETVVGVPPAFWAMKHRVHYEPLGTVLVIGAFNYPFQLTLLPFLGAVAAGNTVMVKPSELSAFSAMIIEKVIEYMDPDCYVCVNGALPVSQAVLDLKFNKIAFTGGKNVGKIIAKKAAETLTPTLLELGGQNPAFITKNANVKLAARRLLWGKTSNGGQVCISHNYAFVERSVLSQFIGELNSQYRVFMPKGAKASPDYCRIVNKSNFDRIRKMLDDSKGKIVMGGSFDETDLFIEPTVVIVNDPEDSMITQESFGPIWSVMPYDSLDDAIAIANEVDPTPLALFAFGNDQETKKSKLTADSTQRLSIFLCLHAY